MLDQYTDWLFDESTHVGVDYADKDLVADYDRQHNSFRDFQKEAERIVDLLALEEGSTVLDIGCGTGGLSVCLARKCRHIHAVDVSLAMVDTLKDKMIRQGLKNITPIQSGFLTYQHEDEPLDAIVANIALHHLPDFWKQIALCRLHDLLKPGGRMFLADVVFDFEPRSYRQAIGGWLNSMRQLAGPRISDETAVHVRDEFSTWEWVMTGMLQRAGFQVDQTLVMMPNLRAYVCSKPCD